MAKSVVTLSEFRKIVEFNLKHGIKKAIIGLGGGGIGKSQSLKQLADSLNIGFKDIRLVYHDETDLLGIPFPNADRTAVNWLKDELFPVADRDGQKGILLLDEFLGANDKVQMSCYQLLQDWCIDSYKLPDGWLPIGISNRECDFGVFNSLPPALVSRVELYEIVPDLESFKNDYALPNNFDHSIIGYLNFKEEDLFTYNAEMFSENEIISRMPYACPRSWSAVNTYLSFLEDGNETIVWKKIRAVLGDDVFYTFKAFYDLTDKLNEVVLEILKGTYSADRFAGLSQDSKISVLSSLTCQMGNLIKKQEKADSCGESNPNILVIQKNIIDFMLSLTGNAVLMYLGLSDLYHSNRAVIGQIFLEHYIDNEAMNTFLSDIKKYL